MSELRKLIIETLLATRNLPEGVAADAILSLIEAPQPEAEPVDSGLIWSIVRDAMQKGVSLGDQFDKARLTDGKERLSARLDAFASDYADKICALYTHPPAEQPAPSNNISELIYEAMLVLGMPVETIDDESWGSVIAQFFGEQPAPVRTCERLLNAAIAIREDLLQRAHVEESGCRVVDVSGSIWTEFKAAIDDGLRKPAEPGV